MTNQKNKTFLNSKIERIMISLLGDHNHNKDDLIINIGGVYFCIVWLFNWLKGSQVF